MCAITPSFPWVLQIQLALQGPYLLSQLPSFQPFPFDDEMSLCCVILREGCLCLRAEEWLDLWTKLEKHLPLQWVLEEVKQFLDNLIAKCSHTADPKAQVLFQLYQLNQGTPESPTLQSTLPPVFTLQDLLIYIIVCMLVCLCVGVYMWLQALTEVF